MPHEPDLEEARKELEEALQKYVSLVSPGDFLGSWLVCGVTMGFDSGGEQNSGVFCEYSMNLMERLGIVQWLGPKMEETVFDDE